LNIRKQEEVWWICFGLAILQRFARDGTNWRLAVSLFSSSISHSGYWQLWLSRSWKVD
jgi:hypothetical protein